jgi:hypothetical protein
MPQGGERGRCVAAALAVGDLDHGQVGGMKPVAAARHVCRVVICLRVRVLNIMKVENVEPAARRIAPDMRMGKGGHALQQCEGQQKKQSSGMFHFHSPNWRVIT